MRRIKASWAPALLLISALTVNSTLDLHNINTDTMIQGRRVEDLISGVDRTQEDTQKASGLDRDHIAARQAPNAGLNINSLLDSVAPDQAGRPTDEVQSTGGDGAAGVNGQSQDMYRNQTSPKEQGQDNALLTDANPSTVTGANGQINPMVAVEDAGKQPQAKSIPETTLTEVLSLTQERPTASMVSGPETTLTQVLSFLPVESTPSPAVPQTAVSTAQRNSTSAIESSNPTAEAKSTTRPVEGLKTTTSSSSETPKAAAAAPTPPAFELLSKQMTRSSVAAVPTTTFSASATSINSASLTADGLAAPTTTAVGVAITVNAGGPGAAMASGFTFPSASNSSSTAAQAAPLSTATPSKDPGFAVIAGPGGGASAGIVGNASAAAVRAANNGGCRCLCACPVGSFPMAAPRAPVFKLEPVMSMSTMQTVVTSAVSSGTGAASAVLTTVALPPMVGTTSVAGSLPQTQSTPSSIAAPSSTPIAPPPPPDIPQTAASLASTPSPSTPSTQSPVPTGVPQPSQAGANAPPAPTQKPEGIMVAQQQQGNGIPFDINTVTLASRVTVNLGRREA